VAGLLGQMVERGGPGSNKSKNVRIKQGTYPLAVHVGPHAPLVPHPRSPEQLFSDGSLPSRPLELDLRPVRGPRLYHRCFRDKSGRFGDMTQAWI
jgi:hypothetical protein